MKITTEMIKAAYSASADVYDKKISKKQAINDLETKFDWNGSPSGFIDLFKKMMEGDKYKRNNNIEATDYFLTHILNDYGVDKLDNTIKAEKEHVKHHESSFGDAKNSIRAIISKHEEILKNISISQMVTVYPDELDNPDETLFEGIKKTVFVNSYERNPIAKKNASNTMVSNV